MSDDEKWSNIVGNDDDEARDEWNQNTIILKQISNEEQQLYRLKSRSKTLKNKYFITDELTTISDEDMQYQLRNTSDTLNKELILDKTKRKQKKLEKFDKLVKKPGRYLSCQLEQYFTKNLKVVANSNDFEISYEEIQNDIARERAIQAKRKLDEPYELPPIIDIPNNHRRNGSTAVNGSANIAFASRAKKSILNDIDLDFKPKMTLSTKTYTRVKANDLP